MRTRIGRLITRLLKKGTLFVFVGIGVMIGLTIGMNSADRGTTIIIRTDNPPAAALNLNHSLEGQLLEPVALGPIPTVPPIPAVPPIPQIPAGRQVIYVDDAPSLSELFDGITTVIAAFGLIGLGVVLIRRGQQQPQEKSPDTLQKPVP